jgi:hypothetical protein
MLLPQGLVTRAKGFQQVVNVFLVPLQPLEFHQILYYDRIETALTLIDIDQGHCGASFINL